MWERQPLESGSSALLECMAFRDTKHRDGSALMAAVDAIGANVLASASREQVGVFCVCVCVCVVVWQLDDATNNRFQQNHTKTKN